MGSRMSPPRRGAGLQSWSVDPYGACATAGNLAGAAPPGRNASCYGWVDRRETPPMLAQTPTFRLTFLGLPLWAVLLAGTVGCDVGAFNGPGSSDDDGDDDDDDDGDDGDGNP